MSSKTITKRWADLDQPARIAATIAATDAYLAHGWHLTWTQWTGEKPTRELPEFDEDTGEPLALWNKDNTNHAKICELFDNLKPELFIDYERCRIVYCGHDYRDDMLLTLATGPSDLLVLRIHKYLYHHGVLEDLARNFNAPPLKPTSYGDDYFNFFFKRPTKLNRKIKTVPVKIVAANDDVFEAWAERWHSIRQESQGTLIIERYRNDNELHDGDLILTPKDPTIDVAAIKREIRSSPIYRFGDIEVLSDGDQLLLPPTIGHWCDGNNDETNVMPEISEMPKWLLDVLGLTEPEMLDSIDKQQHDDSTDAAGHNVDAATSKTKGGVSLEQFVAYMPMHTYIYIPTREPWPGSSVNARIPPLALKGRDGKPLLENGKQKFMSASAFLDKYQPVEQMTWCPGLPLKIKDRLVADGGWFEHKGVTTFNLYRSPTIVHGDPNDVQPWLDHVRLIYPNDAEHILDCLAHRVQFPQDKINHGLVLGGLQGIGKDTIVEPAKRAVGPWNFKEISPEALVGRFNGFLKAVILRVNETRDLGEVNRYQFYERTKPMLAAPPDVHRVDEKNLREHDVFNVCFVIMTTNYKTDGMYLPADDRRHYVAWSDSRKEDFTEKYWNDIWAWYDNGGDRNVAAYLATRDISSFNPKAPPKKTEAFWAIVNANRAPEEGELADILDAIGNPDAVTIEQLTDVTNDNDVYSNLGHGYGRYRDHNSFHDWISDRKNRRAIPHKLEQCGYVPVRNPDATDGLWVIVGKRQAIYAKAELNIKQQNAAATNKKQFIECDHLLKLWKQYDIDLAAYNQAKNNGAKSTQPPVKPQQPRPSGPPLEPDVPF
jgi:hypothetical protein